MNIFFRKNQGTYLDKVNKKLNKNSKGRFELFVTRGTNHKKRTFYLMDYDESGASAHIMSYKEIEDILSCMGLDFDEIKENI